MDKRYNRFLGLVNAIASAHHGKRPVNTKKKKKIRQFISKQASTHTLYFFFSTLRKPIYPQYKKEINFLKNLNFYF